MELCHRDTQQRAQHEPQHKVVRDHRNSPIAGSTQFGDKRRQAARNIIERFATRHADSGRVITLPLHEEVSKSLTDNGEGKPFGLTHIELDKLVSHLDGDIPLSHHQFGGLASAEEWTHQDPVEWLARHAPAECAGLPKTEVGQWDIRTAQPEAVTIRRRLAVPDEIEVHGGPPGLSIGAHSRWMNG